MQTLIKGLVERPNGRVGVEGLVVGVGCKETANVTRSCLFVFIPMALKFSKSNLLATDMTENSVLPQQPPQQLDTLEEFTTRHCNTPT